MRWESQEALAGTADPHAIIHYVDDYRRGIEAARSRHPALVLVEMTSDTRRLEAFAEEMAVVSPGSVVAALFAPDIFGPDVSEGAILIEALRAGVRDFLRRPISSADLDQLLGRLVRHLGPGPRKLGRTTFFLANKGGVGKSTLAVNVACGLAARFPERVILIDASLQMGVCAAMLNLRPTTSMTDIYLERGRLDETLLRQFATPHPSGLHLLAAPLDAIEAAYIDDELMARILTLARRAYDYVIVDSFPLLDRVMMAILDLSDRTYVVLESVVPTLIGGQKLLKLLDDLNIPPERVHVILNRYLNFAGNIKPREVERLLDRPIDHVVPYKKAVVIAANIGRPQVLTAGRFFGFGRAVGKIVDEVARDPTTIRRAEGRPAADGRAEAGDGREGGGR